MTDRALTNAEVKRNQLVGRKQKLLSEIADLDDQIGQVDRFIKAWHAFAEDEPERAVDNLSESGVIKTATTQPAKSKTVSNPKKEEIAAAAYELILDGGVPLKRDELFDRLAARGLVVQGKDPKMVLSTMLWRMREKIARVKGGGYWPADLPNSAAGYDPATAEDFDNTLNKPVGEILDPDSELGRDTAARASEGDADIFN